MIATGRLRRPASCLLPGMGGLYRMKVTNGGGGRPTVIQEQGRVHHVLTNVVVVDLALEGLSGLSMSRCKLGQVCFTVESASSFSALSHGTQDGLRGSHQGQSDAISPTVSHAPVLVGFAWGARTYADDCCSSHGCVVGIRWKAGTHTSVQSTKVSSRTTRET